MFSNYTEQWLHNIASVPYATELSTFNVMCGLPWWFRW